MSGGRGVVSSSIWSSNTLVKERCSNAGLFRRRSDTCGYMRSLECMLKNLRFSNVPDQVANLPSQVVWLKATCCNCGPCRIMSWAVSADITACMTNFFRRIADLAISTSVADMW